MERLLSSKAVVQFLRFNRISGAANGQLQPLVNTKNPPLGRVFANFWKRSGFLPAYSSHANQAKAKKPES